MRRRNLLMGMGAMGIGSGAAALTGATLSNRVAPSADFRVNTEQASPDLVVKKGSVFGSGTRVVNGFGGTNFGANPDIRYIDNGEISALDDEAAFAAVHNDEINENLEFGIRVPFDKIPTSNGATPTSAVEVGPSKLRTYIFGPTSQSSDDGLLKIENNGDAAKDVAIQFTKSVDSNGVGSGEVGYATGGTDPLVVQTGDDGQDLAFDEVAFTFRFRAIVDSGDSGIISPDGDQTNQGTNTNQKPRQAVRIEKDGSVDIQLQFTMSEPRGNEIADYVNNSLQESFVRLMDKIFIVEMESADDDTVEGVFNS